MFEKFGEFDSVKELNTKAAELKGQNDEESLVVLAIENGLTREDAEDYMDDCTDTLATALQAATGKLRMESKELNLAGILTDWVGELINLCIEDEAFRAAVRKKGRGLDGFIAVTADTGYKNRCKVCKKIVEKTVEVKKVIGSHEFSIGIPDKATRRKLAYEYYVRAEA